MPVHRRSQCRLCDSPRVELVVKLEPVPLAEGYCATSAQGKASPCFPVDLYMCAQCGHVQQLDVLDVDSLWSDYTYSSGNAKGMPEHFQEVFTRISSCYPMPQGSLVLDIGSNDGSLLRPFHSAGYKVLGVDPARNMAEKAIAAGIPTLVEPVSLPLCEHILDTYGQAHVVCMFNAFAHMDNLQEALTGIKRVLHQDGIFVFEAQYLGDILDKTLIATIFHEHMSHHSLTALNHFFARYDMQLLDVQRVSVQHGSIIGVVQHAGGRRVPQASVRDLLHEEKLRGLDQLSTLRAFGERVAHMREQVSNWATQCREQHLEVAGFGAARSASTLVAQLGLKGVISRIFDDHPQKVGLFTPGEGTPIEPVCNLYAAMPPYTVILAWVHADKIMAAHREYMERGGRFVVLCPEPRIVDKNGEYPL